MKVPRMANSVGHIDYEMVKAAVVSRKNSRMRWGYLAACLAVLVITGAAILPWFFGLDTGDSGGEKDRYKNFYTFEAGADYLWPWEYKTIYEKYTELKIDGIEYRSKGREVSASLVGDSIGSYTVAGYDEMNGGKKYTEAFEVYALKDVAQSQFVAVSMDGSFYVFKNDEYAPPGTLGELMELVDLPEVVELGRFSENGDGAQDHYFQLHDDSYIWSVLSNCSDAVFVEDQKWYVHDREYLSFTVTSEVLGVYRVAMYVTADGYLWTNAFGTQYLFFIGENAAGEIIQYAKGNSTQVAYEPYRNTVTGTVTQITDEYILVDDSPICNDPADGITYKVLLNDLRISRYVDRGVIEVGDTVQIAYEGEATKDNTVGDAVSLHKVSIVDGDVLIPE